MELSKGFQQTDIGVMPNDWLSVSVEELVKDSSPVCYGVVQVGKNTNDGVPIVAIKYLKNIGSAPLHRAAVDIERNFARSRVQYGDVLISIKGTIGRIGLVPPKFDGNISREIARLRPKENYLPEYLAHQLESGHTQDRITQSVVGTTRLEFSIATLKQFKIPVPKSTKEQEAIANALSDAHAYIESLEKLIAKKLLVKKGAVQELLSGKRRLSGFTEKWSEDDIGNICEITTGSRNTQDRVENGQYPFFVRSQTIERINTHSFDGEAVLTAGDGVGTGKVFHYINGKFDVHQRVYRMSDFREDVDGYYFYLFFSENFYDRIMQMTAKSSVDSVRREMIAGMKIKFPEIDEQKAIAQTLRDLDQEIKLNEDKLQKARLLKQGMMQELLTGRIRLV